MVNSKLLVGDVMAAVRIIASDDSVITPTSEVVTALRLKHPLTPLDLPPPPTESVSQMSSVPEEEVMVALKSFPPSSAGGVDGLQPGHLNRTGPSGSPCWTPVSERVVSLLVTRCLSSIDFKDSSEARHNRTT